jgi:teichuronic acid biosynthesis glycosyltransferase TuaC
MRALWVTNMWPDDQRPWYGAFVYSQARSLRQLGVELEVVYVPGHRGKREYLQGTHALRRALATQAFDVIHAHYGHCGVIARAQLSAPLVVSFCGDDLLGTPDSTGRFSRPSNWLARAFAQLAWLAAATITKSAEMQERLPGPRRARNHIIPNGVDLATFAPVGRAQAKAALRWNGTRPNVLFVGDPAIPRKNFSLARAVCDELARRGRPVELRVATGMPHREVAMWMSAADAMVFPSISEGSPNVLKEAMAAELPIVSAPVGDASERLEGVEGCFIVDRDREAMADALLAALAYGRAPQARAAVERISLERIAQRVLAVYEAVAR